MTFTLVLEGRAPGVGYSVSEGAETAWSRARRSNEDAVLLWAHLYAFSLLLVCPQMSGPSLQEKSLSGALLREAGTLSWSLYPL